MSRDLFKWREPFFVQEEDRGAWHVETPDDPERMLCGLVIPVDANTRVGKKFGMKPCLWCKNILERSSAASLRSR